MSDFPKIVETLATGLLSGGASVLATVLATFRDLRGRLTIAEERLGQPAHNAAPATGLFHTIITLETASNKLRKEIESWEDDPPGWLTRLIARAGRSGSIGMEVQQEFEERVLSRLRSYQERMERMDDRYRDDTRSGIGRSEYDTDQKKTLEAIAELKEAQAATNGLLRGLLATIGVLDKQPPDPPRSSVLPKR